MKRLFFTSFAILLTAICSLARQPERGYRGFVDWTNRIYRNSSPTMTPNQYWSHTNYVPGISTSHGFQFNPWIFAGAGLDYSLEDNGFPGHHSYQLDNYFLSIFADIRTDIQLGKFTPFADVRLGVNATSSGTVYFSPSIGYRFNWGRKVGLNVGVGYTLDSFRYQEFKQVDTIYGYQTWIPTGKYYTLNNSSFTFRVGIDF